MILTRFAYLPTGTLGRLHSEEGQMQLWTLERAWLGNQPYVSCIPEGTYPLSEFVGKKWKGVLEVTGVPGRSTILIHPANQPIELQGCIAPGLSWQVQNGSIPAVGQSREALEIVMGWYHAGDAALTINSERSILATATPGH